jgi:peptidoglycan hydrolase-like protein with peptidoglycan-binding domain
VPKPSKVDESRPNRSAVSARAIRRRAKSQRDQGSRESQHDQAGREHGAQSPRKQSQSEQRNLGQSKQGQSEQRAHGQSKQSETDRRTGESKQSQSEQRTQSQKQGQAEQRRQSDQTNGQAQREHSQSQTQRGQRDSTRGEASQREQGQPREERLGQSRQDQAREGSGRGSVNLTAEQRTRIQQTVFARRDVPRVNDVNFALSVGRTVPTRVRVVEVPDTLIEIHPEWRGHRYFVVRDEIVIVDTGHRIVATLPVSSSTSDAQIDVDRSAQLSDEGDNMNLSADEIRQIQIVLKEQGFDIGEPDGVFDVRTRQAMITFQQRQGLQATGRIDIRTTEALGISIKSGQQGNQGPRSQPSTTGQGGGSREPSANQGQPSKNEGMGAGQNRQNRTGQGGDGMQWQPAHQDTGSVQPGKEDQSPTTGQGGHSAGNSAQPSSPNMNQNSGAPQKSGGQAR